jgi:chorismate mutase
MPLDAFSEWLESRAGLCLVAGPCSVETEEQVTRTALELSRYGVTLLRGGIWKPRTRPGSFEGVGPKGLQWLKAAGGSAGLPVATEAACPAHVDHCLKAGIDVLWIGARTTTSPVAVQEIANALAGVDIPVMIKNPMNPDLELWIGAIERVLNAGVRRVAAVHRGFSTHTRRKYRNQPLWSIPLDLRRRLPDLPLLCDPSHISGARAYLAEVARAAVDLGFDGLMVECHWRPENARSDAEQQLTPAQFGALVQEFGWKPRGDLESRRLARELDEIDEDLDVLLHRRLAVLRQAERRAHVSRASAWAANLGTAIAHQLQRVYPGVWRGIG